MNYKTFLKSKSIIHKTPGINPHEILFPFQRDITKWALRRGRACIFADCGMVRHSCGAELKASYWKQAAANLAAAESESSRDLFAKSA